MYEKDKRQRITVRVSDEQMTFIRSQTDTLGISPSDYVRMLINSLMYVNQHGINSQQQQVIKETLGRENDEAHSDN